MKRDAAKKHLCIFLIRYVEGGDRQGEATRDHDDEEKLVAYLLNLLGIVKEADIYIFFLVMKDSVILVRKHKKKRNSSIMKDYLVI